MRPAVSISMVLALLLVGCANSLCRTAHSDGCVAIGQGLSEREPRRSAQYYSLACRQGAAEGCRELGRIYARGVGVRPSTERALSYLDRACDLRSVDGCYDYVDALLASGAGSEHVAIAERRAERVARRVRLAEEAQQRQTQMWLGVMRAVATQAQETTAAITRDSQRIEGASDRMITSARAGDYEAFADAQADALGAERPRRSTSGGSGAPVTTRDGAARPHAGSGSSADSATDRETSSAGGASSGAPTAAGTGSAAARATDASSGSAGEGEDADRAGASARSERSDPGSPSATDATGDRSGDLRGSASTCSGRASAHAGPPSPSTQPGARCGNWESSGGCIGIEVMACEYEGGGSGFLRIRNLYDRGVHFFFRIEFGDYSPYSGGTHLAPGQLEESSCAGCGSRHGGMTNWTISQVEFDGE